MLLLAVRFIEENGVNVNTKSMSFESQFSLTKHDYVGHNGFAFFKFKQDLCHIYINMTKWHNDNYERIFYSHQKDVAMIQCNQFYMQNSFESINVGIFVFNSIEISFEEIIRKSYGSDKQCHSLLLKEEIKSKVSNRARANSSLNRNKYSQELFLFQPPQQDNFCDDSRIMIIVL